MMKSTYLRLAYPANTRKNQQQKKEGTKNKANFINDTKIIVS